MEKWFPSCRKRGWGVGIDLPYLLWNVDITCKDTGYEIDLAQYDSLYTMSYVSKFAQCTVHCDQRVEAGFKHEVYFMHTPFRLHL